jgi:predicted nuclease of restriction endonuclease-like RecB superfamily
MPPPGHDDDTIENRVYVFESLARAFVEKSADDLGSKNPERRERAIRALADLAYVSCVVADTGHLKPKAVRKRVLSVLEPDAGTHQPEASERDDEG